MRLLWSGILGIKDIERRLSPGDEIECLNGFLQREGGKTRDRTHVETVAYDLLSVTEIGVVGNIVVGVC